MPRKPPTKKPKKQLSQYSKGVVGNFYSSAAWIKLRNKQKRDFPMCANCLKMGILTDATGSKGVADHIKPIIEGGAALDQENLQTLCNGCHAIKTGKETAKRSRK